jgi:hypothetical protein
MEPERFFVEQFFWGSWASLIGPLQKNYGQGNLQVIT